jgi:HPt (histidine-containing phosphotransfer) domain-containing protein
MTHVNDTQGAARPIDDSKLDDLRMLSDDDGPDILSELIDIFLDDTPTRLGELARAIASGDPEGTMQSAHALKSSCAQLGAMQLSDYCRQLEAMGRAQEIGSAHPLLTAAQAEFERARAALLEVKAAR